jgi:hypothetical protein
MLRRYGGLALAVGATALAALLGRAMLDIGPTLNDVAVLVFTVGAVVAGVSLNVWPDKS